MVQRRREAQETTRQTSGALIIRDEGAVGERFNIYQLASPPLTPMDNLLADQRENNWISGLVATALLYCGEEKKARYSWAHRALESSKSTRVLSLSRDSTAEG